MNYYDSKTIPITEPKFTFIKYTPTPEDGNQLGIAEIRINGPVRVLIRYKWVLLKDGKGTFSAGASVCITKEGQKKYLESAQCDSASDSEELKDFIREHVKHWIAQSASINSSAQHAVQQAVQHATSSTAPTASQHGVSANEQLPF